MLKKSLHHMCAPDHSWNKKETVHGQKSFHFSVFQNTLKPQVIEQHVRNQEAGMLTELVRDFLNPAEFYKIMQKIGIDFFCGVPDSLLKDFCAYITDNTPRQKHVITANEGSAVSMAAGYYLATGKFGMVYLQNSGLGNIVNPLMSLASPSVYSIPMLLLVGWRGEPGKRDEPQHKVQGQATPGLLAAMGIPFQPLPDYHEGAEQALKTACHYMKSSKGPYCLLVKRQTFLPYRLKKKEPEVEKDIGHEKDFLTVGSMGHASAIALGIAMQRPNKQAKSVLTEEELKNKITQQKPDESCKQDWMVSSLYLSEQKLNC
ncbi:E4.1.1.82 [Acanthosepion pharaonis]|uniref:E4.1.1.82 n=1 Tax=Acanthosepion pharaonis TaxID=158019 RepID=A0A812CY85_ACAPH|nr:E4.1.1.82 [Sepia pharaonis]